jgi:hypothetical protein
MIKSFRTKIMTYLLHDSSLETNLSQGKKRTVCVSYVPQRSFDLMTRVYCNRTPHESNMDRGPLAEKLRCRNYGLSDGAIYPRTMISEIGRVDPTVTAE